MIFNRKADGRMNNRTAGNIGTAIGVGGRVAEFVLGTLGIISFFFSQSDMYLYTGGALLILGIINMLLLGIGPTTGIIASVIGCICVGRIWPGICIGLSVEAMVVQTIGMIGLILSVIKGTDNKR